MCFLLAKCTDYLSCIYLFVYVRGLCWAVSIHASLEYFNSVLIRISLFHVAEIPFEQSNWV